MKLALVFLAVKINQISYIALILKKKGGNNRGCKVLPVLYSEINLLENYVENKQ